MAILFQVPAILFVFCYRYPNLARKFHFFNVLPGQFISNGKPLQLSIDKNRSIPMN